jgi:flagellar hook-basal body complex protein FliE
MSVNPLAAIGAGALQNSTSASSAADVAATRGFDVIPGVGELRTSAAAATGGAFQTILSGVDQLNSELLQGNQVVRNLALGDIDNLHQSMMALEHARLSLQLLLQIRSGMLDAYRSLMQMQV